MPNKMFIKNSPHGDMKVKARGQTIRYMALVDDGVPTDEYNFHSGCAGESGEAPGLGVRVPMSGNFKSIDGSDNPYGSIVPGEVISEHGRKPLNTEEVYRTAADNTTKGLLQVQSSVPMEAHNAALAEELRKFKQAALDEADEAYIDDTPTDDDDDEEDPPNVVKFVGDGLWPNDAPTPDITETQPPAAQDTALPKRPVRIPVEFKGEFGTFKGFYINAYVDGKLLILIHAPDESVYTPVACDKQFHIVCEGVDYSVCFLGLSFTLPPEHGGLGVQIMVLT